MPKVNPPKYEFMWKSTKLNRKDEASRRADIASKNHAKQIKKLNS